jgi:hypothetical protein
MEENPIDDLNAIHPIVQQKSDPVVKVVARSLFLIVFVFSLLCFPDIIGLIGKYFSFRTRYVIGFELHSLIAALALGSIPMTSFYLWKKRFQQRGFIPYLMILTIMLCFLVLICLLGFECMFLLPSSLKDANPFLPGYAVFPPFGLYFDALFILAATLPFLILQIFIKKPN